MNDPSRLDGHVAVVTGGGTGIGAAIARLLAMHGADVVIAGRTLERLNSTADDIAMASGQQVLPVQTDVREEAAVIELVSRTIAEFGHLDVLVNNAGGSYMFPLLATSPERWDRSVSLNLRAPYLATYHALPHMLARQHGAIVNISSAAAVGGVRGGSAYASAKAGLQMFTRIVAAEHGPHGVRCNAIAVGTVASEGALRSWERFGQSVPELQSLIPLRRVGQPEDICLGCALSRKRDVELGHRTTSRDRRRAHDARRRHRRMTPKVRASTEHRVRAKARTVISCVRTTVLSR